MGIERGIRRMTHKHRVSVGRSAIRVALAGALALIMHRAGAQAVDAPAPQTSSQVKERFLISHFPDKPSAAAFSHHPHRFAGIQRARAQSISVPEMSSSRSISSMKTGCSSPSAFPACCIATTPPTTAGDEREIRAVVLALPQGTVESEASWTVHDRDRYLWMLSNGHFLLRDRNNLLESDASLALKPYLDFPGPLLWLELDPSQQFLVTSSREPVAARRKRRANPSAATAAANATGDASATDADAQPPDLVLRVLHRKSGQVMLVSRVRNAVHLPINSLGFIENLRGRGSQWILDLNYFTGGTKMLGNVDSTCEPRDDFLSEHEILVTGCGGRRRNQACGHDHRRPHSLDRRCAIH